MKKLMKFARGLVFKNKKNNVVELANQAGDKATEILRFSLATKLNTTVDLLPEALLKLASTQMAQLPDGYIIYTCNGSRRAALVINMTLEAGKFPFIYHADDGESSPVDLLYADMEYESLGSFVDYICRDENLQLYHAVVTLVPRDLNGIGVIQSILNAKLGDVCYHDEMGIRRIIKQTIEQLRA
jgi:hypothetical protein